MRSTITATATILFCILMGVSLAEAESPNTKSDSLKAAAIQTFGQCQGLIETGSSVSLDSAVSLLTTLKQAILAEFGPEDTLMAGVYHHLARCHYYMADHNRAADFSEAALKIYEETPGEFRDEILTELGWLCSCTREAGDFVKCEQTTERRFSLLGHLSEPYSHTERLQLVSALEDRGCLRIYQNRYDEAYADLTRALELLNDDPQSESYSKATLLANTGLLFANQGKNKEAEEWTYKAFELFRKSHHYRNMLMTCILMSNYIANGGELRRANMWVDSALIWAKEIDFSHPALAEVYRTKAKLFAALDSAEAAVEYANLAVEFGRAGSHHWNASLNFLLRDAGKIALAAGDINLGVRRFDEMLSGMRTILTTVFGYASEDQKLAYLQRYRPLLSEYVSFAAACPDPRVHRGVMDMLLNGKGFAIDALAAEQAAAICSGDTAVYNLLEELKSTCGQIARLSLTMAGHDETIGERLDALYTTKDKIEKSLSNLCFNFTTDYLSDSITATAVASALPDNSILWEFIRYYRDDTGRWYKGDAQLGAYYAVVALTPADNISFVDLGPARIIDSLVLEYRSAMEEALSQQIAGPPDLSLDRYKRISAALHRILVSPLQNTLAGTDDVYVAADGMINLLPFETLTKDGDVFLVEDHQFIYLTSGRDLLRDKIDLSGHDAFVLADPDYMIDPKALPALAASESAAMFAYRGNTDTPECLGSMFSPLPMTRQEGRSAAELLGQTGKYNIIYLESGQAREGVLKNLSRPPGVLHIATHGYFCEEAENPYLTNPLLRSGLILAGANRTIGEMNEGTDGGEDGILTAMEVSGLNLMGTDLVVLSACQTGIGDVQNGEGVFGLRRAFQQAGAKSVIMSMFTIPDESTYDIMLRFYEKWLSGESKSSALRDASLSILNERRSRNLSTHPLFWGGFILVGDSD